MSYLIYDKQTGKIDKIVKCSFEHLVMQYDPQIYDYIESELNDNTHVIDGIAVYISPPPPPFEDLKKHKKNEIKRAFETAFYQGYTTQGFTENFKIDCRREDKDNLESLVRYMNKKNVSSTTLRDFDNNYHTGVTKQDIDMLIDELIEYGLYLYQHKWEKEAEISMATEENIDTITW
jgi:hypothetical protein